jgi:L-2-hydroxyglutarate oxidase
MTYDVVIIGGGIVGLATAYQLKKIKPDLQLLLLEKEPALAKHQTGNNSGVMHSGIYYKPGSLKATNCIRGYHQLVAFCQLHNVPFDLCGKIIVATDASELPALKNIADRGVQNGLSGLKNLRQEELKSYEPHVAGIAGIFVPQTGIVDYTQVAQKYGEQIKNMGGDIKLATRVTHLRATPNGMQVETTQGDWSARLVINCAGLYSDVVARFTTPQLPVKIIPFRGEYYQLKKEKEHLVKNLIYPVPDPNFPFLGVHFTRMARGGVEAGPNAVLAFKREGYSKSAIHAGELWETLTWPGFQKVARKYWRTGLGEMYRSFSKVAFTKALQKLIPEITERDLAPGGAGVRAQACDRDGGLVDDFLILEEKSIINVCNAPSPAATSSLAIGETVSNLALKRFV